MSTKVPTKCHQWRYRLVLFVMVTVGVFLFYRALDIQVLDNEKLQAQGEKRHLRTIDLPAHRGMILDRNGEVLAMNTPVTSVWANPKLVLQAPQNFAQLSSLIGRPSHEIQRTLQAQSGKDFIYLQRHLNPEIAVSVRALDIRGVFTEREFRRYYPLGDVAAHIVGFENAIERGGLTGFEYQANVKLKGTPGKHRVIQDLNERVIDSVGFIETPKAGANIHLSIDKRLQYIAYSELKKSVIKHKALAANLVILDALTGEVLAMVNYPAFNPNDYTKSSAEKYKNLAITDIFEPGSTIKPFIAAAALKTKDFHSQSLVNTSPGNMRVARATIADVRDFGELDLTGIIKKSSNVGIVKIALKMERENLWETLSDFGFGEKTGSGFPGEGLGYLPFFSEWTKLTQATLSFGYGLSVTSLQLAQSYALFANKGYLKPVSVYRVDEAPEGKQVLSEEISVAVLNMMETVVSKEGTAFKAAIPGYRVAGKTGTMKKPAPGGYYDDKYLSVFAGVVPVSRPRLVGVVFFDEPSNGAYYGGEVAAPVFSRVMSEALRLQNIAPDKINESELRVAHLEARR